MSKYFLVNNKQEWMWLMRNFEAEDAEIGWWGDRSSPTNFSIDNFLVSIVIELDSNKKLQYAAKNYYLENEKISTDQIIEVGKLMEGEKFE